jgi:hypothetical protein
MSEDLEVDDDVFLEEGVLYCICGNPVEADDAPRLIEREAGREFIACPTCEMKHFAESGKFRLDEE